jgi:hypothetical protein
VEHARGVLLVAVGEEGKAPLVVAKVRYDSSSLELEDLLDAWLTILGATCEDRQVVKDASMAATVRVAA